MNKFQSMNPFYISRPLANDQTSDNNNNNIETKLICFSAYKILSLSLSKFKLTKFVLFLATQTIKNMESTFGVCEILGQGISNAVACFVLVLTHYSVSRLTHFSRRTISVLLFLIPY